MSIEEREDWECMANHTPQWIENLSSTLSAVMNKKDKHRVMNILDRYNELTDIEEDPKEDAFSTFGIENEKSDLVNEYVAIHEKYKSEAEELQKSFN